MNIFQPQSGSVDLDFEQDYISNLPKIIKEEVLMKLPIKEAVRTKPSINQMEICMDVNSKSLVQRRLCTV